MTVPGRNRPDDSVVCRARRAATGTADLRLVALSPDEASGAPQRSQKVASRAGAARPQDGQVIDGGSSYCLFFSQVPGKD
jgi:hypothetical protein